MVLSVLKSFVLSVWESQLCCFIIMPGFLRGMWGCPPYNYYFDRKATPHARKRADLCLFLLLDQYNYHRNRYYEAHGFFSFAERECIVDLNYNRCNHDLARHNHRCHVIYSHARKVDSNLNSRVVHIDQRINIYYIIRRVGRLSPEYSSPT